MIFYGFFQKMERRKMKTRSSILPLYPEWKSPSPVYVPLGDLYTAWKEDYIQFVYESSSLMTEDKKKQKLSLQLSGGQFQEEFIFQHYSQHPQQILNLKNIPRATPRLQSALDHSLWMIYKYSFVNKKSHITGTVDAFFSLDFIRNQLHLFPPSEITQPYVMVVMNEKENLNHVQYHVLKATAYSLYALPEESRLERNWVLMTSVKKNLYEWVEITMENKKKVKDLVQNIRKTKRNSLAFFDFQTYHPRVLPNMKHDSGIWEKEKKAFAQRIGEITSVWGCTLFHRKHALRKGLVDYRQCQASDLGFFSGKKQAIVDAIIRIHKSSDPNEWLYIHSEEGLEELRSRQKNQLLFLDFEWVDDIYLIGVFEGSTRSYKSFWASSLESQAICVMFQEFVGYIRSKSNCTLVYWYAEKMKWNSQIQKLNLDFDLTSDVEWLDLCAVMRESAVVKGALNFSLKSIGRAYFDQGKMPYFLDDFACQNGKDSILFAKEYYETRDENIKKEIEDYNKFDCESMYYIAESLF